MLAASNPEGRFQITVMNVNDLPTNIMLLQLVGRGRTSPLRTEAGTLASADEDAGGTHADALEQAPAASENGQLQIAGKSLQTAQPLNFESGATRPIRVRTTDDGGLSLEKRFMVTIMDRNDAPIADDEGNHGREPRPWATPRWSVQTLGWPAQTPRPAEDDRGGISSRRDDSITANGLLRAVAGTFATNVGGTVGSRGRRRLHFSPRSATLRRPLGFLRLHADRSEFGEPPGRRYRHGPCNDRDPELRPVRRRVAQSVAMPCSAAPLDSSPRSMEPAGRRRRCRNRPRIFLYDGAYGGGLEPETDAEPFPGSGMGSGSQCRRRDRRARPAAPAAPNSRIDGSLMLAARQRDPGHTPLRRAGAVPRWRHRSVRGDEHTRPPVRSRPSRTAHIDQRRWTAEHGVHRRSSTGQRRRGISLTAVNGGVTAAGGALGYCRRARTRALSGGNANFTYGGTISDDVAPSSRSAARRAERRTSTGSSRMTTMATAAESRSPLNSGATGRSDGGLTRRPAR